MKSTAPPPLVKTLTVPIPPDRAFDLFTRRMGEWWPLHSHAVSPQKCQAPAAGVLVPDRVGANVVETLADGSTAVWGEVRVHQPGKCFAMTWHPGSDPAHAGLVTVVFAPEAGGTRVTLTHSGWENRPDGAAARANYDRGWDGVLLNDFGDAAAPHP